MMGNLILMCLDNSWLQVSDGAQFGGGAMIFQYTPWNWHSTWKLAYMWILKFYRVMKKISSADFPQPPVAM